MTRKRKSGTDRPASNRQKRKRKQAAKRGIKRPATPPKRNAKPRKKTAKLRKKLARLSKADLRVDVAILEMNRGRSLTATARALRLPPEELRTRLRRLRLLKRQGKRWVFRDNRARRVPVLTGGRSRVVTVSGFAQASLTGEHHAAVREFVRTNNVARLKRFTGRRLKAANGREYLLETDPNVLHKLAAVDTPLFHEIYDITSST